MASKTDELNWTIPTPGSDKEADRWAQMLVDLVDDDIEPDVVEALNQKQDFSVPIYHVTAGDAASIQTQLDAARADGGGVVFVPAGTYGISTPLSIFEGTTLWCAPGATIRRVNADIKWMLYNWDGDEPTRDYGSNIRVIGGTWDINGDSLSGPSEGIVFRHAENAIVSGVTVEGVNSFHSITFGWVHNGTIRDSTLRDGVSLGDTSGHIQLEHDDETSDCQDILIDNVTVTQPGVTQGAAIDSHHAALSPDPQRDIIVRDCVFDNVGNGLFIKDATNITVRGTAFHSIGTDAVNFDSNTVNAKLESNQYNGASVTDNGTRTVRNGIGTNNGDPSTTGEWNGHGHEGLIVANTNGTRPYPIHRYIDGAWQTSG